MKRILIAWMLALAFWCQGGTTNSVTLAWDPSPDEVDGYILYVGLNTNVFTEPLRKVGPTPPANTNVTVTYLPGKTVYFFVVTAYSGNLESVPSNMVSWTNPAPVAPENLRIELGTNEVSVLWDKGTLEQAPSLQAKFSPVDEVSPLIVTPKGTMFYRVRL